RCDGDADADTAAHRGRSESASSSLVLALPYEYKTDPARAIESNGHHSVTLKPPLQRFSAENRCIGAVDNGKSDICLSHSSSPRRLRRRTQWSSRELHDHQPCRPDDR